MEIVLFEYIKFLERFLKNAACQGIGKPSIFVSFLKRIACKTVMIRYKNLAIIGTSHIARQSVDEVISAIENIKPEIIALELDRKRLYALMHGKKGRISVYDLKRVGVKGFLFSLIGAWAEKKLGEIVGVSPGSEMLAAINLAKKNNIRIALVDQDIEVTLKRFSQSLTWREKWNFLVDIIRAVVFKKTDVEFDLTKVPGKKVIREMIKKVRDRYPNIYKVLIEERNEVIGRNLKEIMAKNEGKKIAAIIGAGHEDDLIDIIKRPAITYSVRIG